MTYRQLQIELKNLRAAGKTQIKLNSKKVALQAEYDRLTKKTTKKVRKPILHRDVDYAIRAIEEEIDFWSDLRKIAG